MSLSTIIRPRVLSTLRKASRLSLVDWLDLIRATFELALARWALFRLSSHDLIGPPPGSGLPEAMPSNSERATLLVGRVSRAVTRMAGYVPWRSDCLVQALAARRWLAIAGIHSTIGIGVRRDDQFEAHAWLCASEIIVTGGDISQFVPLPLDKAGAKLMDRGMLSSRSHFV